jgi:hypothetical protein
MNSVSLRSVMFDIFYPEMFCFFLQAGEDVAKKVMETQGGQCLECLECLEYLIISNIYYNKDFFKAIYDMQQAEFHLAT